MSLLNACQSTSSKADAQPAFDELVPSWVSAPPASSRYIYGVGVANIAPNIEQATSAAKDSARAEIVKAIKVSVTADTQLAQQADNNGSMSFQFSELIKNSTPTIELVGIQFTEQFINKTHNTLYVLAEFDKQAAILQIQQEIAEVDQVILGLPFNLSLAKTEQLKHAIEANKLKFKRQQLNERLVTLSSPQLRLSADVKMQLTKAQRVFDNILFAVVSHDKHDLANKLMQILTDKGIKVSRTSQADFKLEYQVNWRELVRNDMFYSIANATVTLTADDKYLATFKQKAKGVSTDAGLAQDKAIDKLANHFTEQLSVELFKAFD